MGLKAGCLKNMPKWPIDYFELKFLEKQMMQEEHSGLLSVHLKAGNESPCDR